MRLVRHTAYARRDWRPHGRPDHDRHRASGCCCGTRPTSWADYEAAARRVEALGYDHLWAWDHLYAIFGDPYQPIFEGYTTLAAMAKVTTRVRLGLLVGANTFRNPAVVAKMLTTIDHVERRPRDRRASAAPGSRPSIARRGIEFGTGFGAAARLARRGVRGPAAPARRRGRAPRPRAATTRFDDFRVLPRPVQQRLPIMIGGSGEKKTLRTVARYADMWNAMGDAEFLRRKVDVLRRPLRRGRTRHRRDRVHASAASRSSGDTEAEARRAWEAQMAHNRTPMADVLDDDTFWVGTPDLIAERMLERRRLGFHTFLAELAAPYDVETLERWIGEVRPAVDAA